MSDMKCPFCQQKLEETMFARGRVFVSCNNPKCPIMDWGGCSKQIITELIRTRKALDVAVDALKQIKPEERKNCVLVPTQLTIQRIVNEALEQITALEQKE